MNDDDKARIARIKQQLELLRKKAVCDPMEDYTDAIEYCERQLRDDSILDGDD